MNELDPRFKFNSDSVNNKEVGDSKAYVYHVTGWSLSETILAEGLKPLNPNHRNLVDAFMDQFAPDGFSRSSAIFAHPDINLAFAARGYNFGSVPQRVVVQAEVDPSAVFVSNMRLYSQVERAFAARDITEAERLSKSYWSEGMLLGDYLSLDENDPRQVRDPEALIPKGVAPEHLQLL